VLEPDVVVLDGPTISADAGVTATADNDAAINVRVT
jgi:hypothetical protein